MKNILAYKNSWKKISVEMTSGTDESSVPMNRGKGRLMSGSIEKILGH